MGLLASCGLAANPKKIDIYGPPGLDAYLQACRKYSQTHFSYPIEVHTVQPGLVLEEEDFWVSCAPLEHRVTAFGYRVQERDRMGHFDVKKAAALGIPSGPLYGQLKRGGTVTLPNGQVVKGTDLCGPTEKGRKIAYCTDTIYCQNAVDLAQDADVVIHEATFAHQDAELAYQRLHSTSTMAAQVALNASAQRLFLSHFSPRYAVGGPIQLQDLLAEARAIFPNSEIAHDFLSYTVPRHSQEAPEMSPAVVGG